MNNKTGTKTMKHLNQSKIKIKRFSGVLAVSTVLVLAAVVGSFSTPAGAESLDEIRQQISEAEKLAKEYEAKAKELSGQVASLSDEVARLQAEQLAVQEKIGLSQMKHDELVEEIKITEKEIKDNRDALGVVLADKYLIEKTTLIERIACSDNLSSFIDSET
jgi:peptidoglycan hydrolase CwlO-like protein